MKFSALDLAPNIQQALDACGYEEMTPVQEQAIVPARRGKNVLANAQTGTGKTAAFSLPILQQIHDNPQPVEPGYTRALILTPTRELAEQLAETIGRYAQYMDLRIVTLYGGVKMEGQAGKLKQGADLIIATPGRLLEHTTLCNIYLSKTEFLVLDEADRMLDMGFIADVHSLIKQTPEKRQTLMFSATISPTVNELARELMPRHEVVRVAKVNATADTVDHVVYPVEEKRKADLFAELIEKNQWFQVLVFTSTKAQADELMTDLKIDNIPAAVCHGDKTQGSRRRAIADFKAGKIQVLVATEVAARGLDIQGLELVVNYNLPYLAEDYVHRIGRTGRAGAKGKAISFVSREEEQALDNIEHLIGARIRRVHQKGYEVGSRDGLKKRINKKPRVAKAKSNKVTRTKILKSKSGTAKPAKRKKK